MRDRLRRLRKALFGLVTPLGWTILILGVVAWAAGAVLGWSEMMIVAATAAVLLAIAAALTAGRIDVESGVRVAPPHVVVGTRAVGELTLRNRRQRTIRGLRVELPVGRKVALFSFPNLRGGASVEELFVVPTNRRAVIPVGPVTTVQGDPIGLLRRIRVWSGVDEIYVHPATGPVASLAAGLIRDMEGQATNNLSPSDVAFHTLRDYVPGDDRRHIHWKTTAKKNKYQVRQYVDTRRTHVAVAVAIDLDEYADEDEFELAISCAASYGLQAMRDGQTLSLFAGAGVMPTSGPKVMLDAFSGIEGVRGQGGSAACIRAIRQAAAGASIAVLCTGRVADLAELRRTLGRLDAGTESVVVRAVPGATARFRQIGNTTAVDVPGLASLALDLQRRAV